MILFFGEFSACRPDNSVFKRMQSENQRTEFEFRLQNKIVNYDALTSIEKKSRREKLRKVGYEMQYNFLLGTLSDENFFCI